MFTSADLEDLKQGHGDVVSQDGEKIGAIGDFYLDDDTDNPTWVTVKTGLFGTKESFVPLEGARIAEENLVVPYTKDHVKDAPRVDADEHLEPGEEDRLYRHYNRSAPQSLADSERARNEAALQDGPIGRRQQQSGGLRRRPPGTSMNQPIPVQNTPIVETTDRPAVGTDRPIVETDSPVVESDRPILDTERPVVETERPAGGIDRPGVETERPVGTDRRLEDDGPR